METMDLKDRSSVSLGLMEQLSEAQCADDDWTGLGDRGERRKRQTRLAVRAHRRRKALAALESGGQSPSQASLVAPPRRGRGPVKDKEAKAGSFRVIEWKPETGLKGQTTYPPSSQTKSSILVRVDTGCVIPPGLVELVTRLNHPSPHRPLPMSLRDLLPVVQFNLLRAALTNAITLSLHNLVGNCTTVLSRIELFPAPDHVPANLRPTALQEEVNHEGCIDIIPSPTMRDNAIRYAEKFSQANFVRDVLGRDVTETGEPMLIAWADPWDPSGWEVTELFLERYGFLVKGCTDVMIATNRWRALRGEGPIVWEVA